MSKAIVNVVTGNNAHYLKGQIRLRYSMDKHAPDAAFVFWQSLPATSPSHQEMPYAFKAHALEHAKMLGHTQLLWADASIVAIAPLDRIWEYAQKHGVWFSKNGYRNSEWTAESAYPLLFPMSGPNADAWSLPTAKSVNSRIEHVVATTFAVDLTHPDGREFLKNYGELARNGSFRGPWTGGIGVQHRHDQTAASVIVDGLGTPLTDPPQYFCYAGGEVEGTYLVADGGHTLAL